MIVLNVAQHKKPGSSKMSIRNMCAAISAHRNEIGARAHVRQLNMDRRQMARTFRRTLQNTALNHSPSAAQCATDLTLTCDYFLCSSRRDVRTDDVNDVPAAAAADTVTQRMHACIMRVCMCSRHERSDPCEGREKTNMTFAMLQELQRAITCNVGCGGWVEQKLVSHIIHHTTRILHV